MGGLDAGLWVGEGVEWVLLDDREVVEESCLLFILFVGEVSGPAWSTASCFSCRANILRMSAILWVRIGLTPKSGLVRVCYPVGTKTSAGMSKFGTAGGSAENFGCQKFFPRKNSNFLPKKSRYNRWAGPDIYTKVHFRKSTTTGFTQRAGLPITTTRKK